MEERGKCGDRIDRRRRRNFQMASHSPSFFPPSLPPFSRWPNIFSALILGANRPRAIELCGPQKGSRSHAALRCSYPRPLPIPKYSVFRIPHDSLRLRSSVQSVGLSSNQSIPSPKNGNCSLARYPAPRRNYSASESIASPLLSLLAQVVIGKQYIQRR